MLHPKVQQIQPDVSQLYLKRCIRVSLVVTDYRKVEL